MSLSFTIRRNDHLPTLDITLGDKDGTAVNLTSAASVAFHMSLGPGSPVKVNANAAITSASAGEVRYAWVEGDTDTAGTWVGEFEVTWGDGKKETFPNTGFIDITIEQDLA